MTRYSSIEEVNAILIELEEHERSVSTDKANSEKHSDVEKPPSSSTSGSTLVNGQNLVNGILEENGGVHEGIPDSDSNSESSTIDLEGHDEEEDLDEEDHDDVGDSEDDYDDGDGIEDDRNEEVHFRQRVIEVDPLEEAEFEKELKALMQELDGADARLADYFDVVSGTSTGGLIAAMVTAPKKEDNRPLYAAKEIVPFILQTVPTYSPKDVLCGPKYDGEYLHQLIKGILGDTKLHQALTNLVIPAFDIKKLQPTVLSTFQVTSNPEIDVNLSDICISTSAAPTYLPAHHFTNTKPDGSLKEFNMIDGGVAANNPALVAIGEVTKKVFKNPDFSRMKPLEFDRFLVISLGTGTEKNEHPYNATVAAKWGIFGWLYNEGRTPLMTVFNQASSDMVDYHLSVVFEALQSEQNYLRIQDDTLCGTLSSVDISTTKNLKNLVKVGEELLKKPVSRVNIDTGLNEPIPNGGTNEEALKAFAKRLSDEKKFRESKITEGTSS